MTTPRDDIDGLINGWSCNERNRSADSCRNPCGCHCREITALQARVKELEGYRALYEASKGAVVREQSRALRAEQERDEAYERAAKVAHDIKNRCIMESTNPDRPRVQQMASSAQAFTASEIAAAIRQLAVSNEKEGK